MRFIQVLACCMVTLATVIPRPPVSPSDITSHLRLRDSDSEDDTDSSSAAMYELASAAARKAGQSLDSGTWYYFMNCVYAREDYVPLHSGPARVYREHGCQHVGIVVGKTARFGVKKFKAVYIHVRKTPDGNGGYNDGLFQSSNEFVNYGPRYHGIIWGGKTSGSKANVNRLVRAGAEWIDGTRNVFNDVYNCVTHYEYLASLLR
ncbi:hypothetical protein Cob_v002324 [Colletotrichum orbiculare MAFF 240422]|uniref:Uncharacterized protein n=1 Tax=Colletotrichum orbiculare (strain 104-T / ATCC 96160 / CBS 514.97 / LARS 414 / MAFF 240422) TaxID=1213857 RepID=N4VLS5_COLOR|nr:hypothetical protein Cob_v002324 [Colletotrichum orbiculare MAFF 240422]